MKKIVTLLFAGAFAMSASAAALNWSATGISVDGNKVGASTAVTGYLIYLGSGGSYAGSYELKATSTTDSIISSVGSEVSSKNKPSATSKLTGTYNFSATNATQANGDVFGMLLTYTTGDVTYYNLSSSTYTLSGMSGDDFADTPSFSFNYTPKTTGGTTLTAGGGWVSVPAVPEPATGALALAGIALLFKRRKARA